MLMLAMTISALATNSAGPTDGQNMYSTGARTSTSHDPPANSSMGDNISPNNNWGPNWMAMVPGSATGVRTPEELVAQRVCNDLAGTLHRTYPWSYQRD